MDAKDQKREKMPEIIIQERRSQRGGELSSAEIMNILRKRAARLAGKELSFEVEWKKKMR